MTDVIYLVEGNQMRKAELFVPSLESDFQQMLIDHPALLAGAQMNPTDPLNWLLIQKEMRVPDPQTGNDRWYVDHLFVDQYGVPTLVEVKRSKDTRIRREVVGQMLDYAANGQIYWDVEYLQQCAANTHGELLDQRVFELAGDDSEEFWLTVANNLNAGRLRLLFVADKIPVQLLRIIEYLNEHMQLVEVLGVELQHYQDGASVILVPRLFGQTETLRARKQSSGRIDNEELINRSSGVAATLFEKLWEIGQEHGAKRRLGTRGFVIEYPSKLLVYGYPKREDGSDEEYVDFRLHEKFYTPEQIELLRQMVLQIDEAFTLSGRLSVRCYVNAQTEALILSANDQLIEKIKAFD